jgi:thiopeptide-type bacteriocin biosynthesis protein
MDGGAVTHRTTRWGSLHAVPHGNAHEFFATTFAPAYGAMQRRPECQRQFFIRYSEGGLHFRWRVLPAPGYAPTDVVRLARQLLRRHRSVPGFDLRSARYSRTHHYFGETWATVYAELLNERSSVLAVQLFGAMGRGHRARRVAIVGAALAEAVGASDHATATRLLMSGLHVSARALAAVDATAPGRVSPATIGTLRTLRERLRPAVQPLAELVTRLERGGRHPHVAPHALHLIANKSGLGPAGEAMAFTAALASYGQYGGATP